MCKKPASGFLNALWVAVTAESTIVTKLRLSNYRSPALLLFATALAANVSCGRHHLTPALKKEIVRGQLAANVPQELTYPSRAIPYLTDLEKRYQGESKAFRLGFAMTALSHILTAQQFTQSLPEELREAGTGYVIFSSDATVLQHQLNLTDAEMAELFGTGLARALRKLNAPL